MKIIVREDRQITIRAEVPISIKDISSEIQRVTVRLLRIGTVVERKPPTVSETNLHDRKRTWSKTFHRLLEHSLIEQSIQATETITPILSTPKRPRLIRPSTKTVEFRITIPTIPKTASFADIKAIALEAERKFTGAKLKTRIVLILTGILILAGCYGIIAHHSPKPPVANVSNPYQKNLLTKGTPNYATVLPTGKTIQQLGGWTRVSPKSKNAVFAYVDKIGSVQIDVSEQPLPANFQYNTDQQVAQLAHNFNATEKVPAVSTNIYIATLADDSQAVILAKNNLLILMKSVSLVPPNQWVAYVNSLQ